MSRMDDLLEAERRGILPPNLQNDLNEARSRGIVSLPGATQPQPVPQPQQAVEQPQVSPEQQLAQEATQMGLTPESALGGLSAIQTGVKRGLAAIPQAVDIGLGALGVPGAQERAQLAGQEFAREREAQKVAGEAGLGFVGEILPAAGLGAATIPRAIGAGAAAGVITPSEDASLGQKAGQIGVGAAAGGALAGASKALGSVFKAQAGRIASGEELRKAGVSLDDAQLLNPEETVRTLNNSVNQFRSQLNKNVTKDLGVDEFITESVSNSYKLASREGGKKFDNFFNAVKKTGEPINLDNTKNVLFRATKEAESILGESGDRLEKVLGRHAKRLEKVGELSGEQLQSLRSSLTTAQRSAKDAGTSQILGDVITAIDDDTIKFASKTAPEIGELAREARAFWRSSVVPFRGDRTLRNIVEGRGDIDKVFARSFRDDTPQATQKVFSRLGGEAQARAKAEIVDKLYAESFKEGIFNATKFGSKVDKLGETADVVFNQAERETLRAFSNASKILADDVKKIAQKEARELSMDVSLRAIKDAVFDQNAPRSLIAALARKQPNAELIRRLARNSISNELGKE